MNSLINYVYEFGSGRGKLSKSPLISSYSTAFCELSIAVMASLSHKSHSCSLSLADIRSCQYIMAGQWRSQCVVMLMESSSHHLHLNGCPVVTCENVGHLIFNLQIDRCILLGIDIIFFLELTVWCSRLWSLVCCDASLYACSV